MRFVIYETVESVCQQQSPVAINYLPKFQAGFTEKLKKTPTPVSFEGFEPCLSHLREGPNYYPELEDSDLILDFESVRQWAPKYSMNLPNGSPNLVRQKNPAFGAHLYSLL